MGEDVFLNLNEGNGKPQIICFPYLGGYANSFYNFSESINKDYEIWVANPPGHGGSKLPLQEDINDLIDIYYKELKSIIKPEYIFFGHSMGGVISYILAHKIQKSEEYVYKPKALVLSASGTYDEFAEKKLSNLSDKALISQLISYGGMPEEILQEESLLEYLLPVFRADYKVLESAATINYGILDIPAYLLWGEKDKIEPLQSVLKWSSHFKEGIKFIPIKDGTHMFLHDKVSEVAKYLETIIL